MKLISILILSALTVLISCNTRFIVSNKKVIHEQDGYMYYNSDGAFFIPGLDGKKDFFSQISGKMAYRIYDGCGVGSMKAIAKKYYVQMEYTDGKSTGIFNDSIFVTPVNVRYLPIHFDKYLILPNRIMFIYDSIQYSFPTKSLFYGEAMSVNGR